MNMSDSECSCGSESGWTVYLDNQAPAVSHPSGSSDGGFMDQYGGDKGEDDEEEDLSMVSDASSRPPGRFRDDDDDVCFYPAFPAATTTAFSRRGNKPQTNKNRHCRERRRRRTAEPSSLDDTATSHHSFNLSRSNAEGSRYKSPVGSILDYSHGFSATDYEQSALQDHFGFFYQSLNGKTNFQEQNQWIEGKRWI